MIRPRLRVVFSIYHKGPRNQAMIVSARFLMTLDETRVKFLRLDGSQILSHDRIPNPTTLPLAKALYARCSIQHHHSFP